MKARYHISRPICVILWQVPGVQKKMLTNFLSINWEVNAMKFELFYDKQ